MYRRWGLGWGERLCRCSEAQLEAMKNGCYCKERAGVQQLQAEPAGEGMGLEAGEKPGPGPVQRQCRTYFFSVTIMDVGCTRKDANHFPPCYEHLASEHLIYTAIHCTAVFYRENSNSHYWVAV